VEKVNKELPLHSMWDGFWIASWKRKTLIVSASFDKSLYRDYDIVFKRVTFFNLPEQWRDTAVRGDDLLRIASVQEFQSQQPCFEVGDRTIFAIDIYLGDVKHTFFIIAKNIYLIKCPPADRYPIYDYTDPYGEEKDYPSLKNRVTNF